MAGINEEIKCLLDELSNYVLERHNSKMAGTKITHEHFCLFGPLRKIPETLEQICI